MAALSELRRLRRLGQVPLAVRFEQSGMHTGHSQAWWTRQALRSSNHKALWAGGPGLAAETAHEVPGIPAPDSFYSEQASSRERERENDIERYKQKERETETVRVTERE